VGGGRKRGKEGEEQGLTQQDKGKKKRQTQRRWWEGVPWMTSVEMTKLVQKWGGGGKVIIANTERLLQYVREGAQEGRQEEGLQMDAVVINTGAHWLLGRYSITEKRMVIHEPYPLQDIMDSTRKLRDMLEAEGWGVKVVGTHKQHTEDGNTCGYHVLKWVIDLIASDKEALRWRAPEYEAEEWVGMVRKEMGKMRAWKAEEEKKIEARKTEQKKRETIMKRLAMATQKIQVKEGALRKMHMEMEEGYWKGLMERFRIEKDRKEQQRQERKKGKNVQKRQRQEKILPKVRKNQRIQGEEEQGLERRGERAGIDSRETREEAQVAEQQKKRKVEELKERAKVVGQGVEERKEEEGEDEKSHTTKKGQWGIIKNLVINWLEQRQIKEGVRKMQTPAVGGKGKAKKEGKWEVIFRKRGGHRGRRQGPARRRKQMINSKWSMGDTIEKMLKRRKKKGHTDQTIRKKGDKGVKIVSHNIRGGIGTGSKWPEIVDRSIWRRKNQRC